MASKKNTDNKKRNTNEVLEERFHGEVIELIGEKNYGKRITS